MLLQSSAGKNINDGFYFFLESLSFLLAKNEIFPDTLPG
jgi:hypothetical protein